MIVKKIRYLIVLFLILKIGVILDLFEEFIDEEYLCVFKFFEFNDYCDFYNMEVGFVV